MNTKKTFVSLLLFGSISIITMDKKKTSNCSPSDIDKTIREALGTYLYARDHIDDDNTLYLLKADDRFHEPMRSQSRNPARNIASWRPTDEEIKRRRTAMEAWLESEREKEIRDKVDDNK